MMEARSFLRQAHRNANAGHVEVRTTIRWGAKRFVVVDYADMDSIVRQRTWQTET